MKVEEMAKVLLENDYFSEISQETFEELFDKIFEEQKRREAKKLETFDSVKEILDKLIEENERQIRVSSVRHCYKYDTVKASQLRITENLRKQLRDSEEGIITYKGISFYIGVAEQEYCAVSRENIISYSIKKIENFQKVL